MFIRRGVLEGNEVGGGSMHAWCLCVSLLTVVLDVTWIIKGEEER